MVAEGSALAHKRVNQKACCARAKGSCSASAANVKGTLKFHLWNDRDERIYQSGRPRCFWSWSEHVF